MLSSDPGNRYYLVLESIHLTAVGYLEAVIVMPVKPDSALWDATQAKDK
jgi:hypothetical protein